MNETIRRSSAGFTLAASLLLGAGGVYLVEQAGEAYDAAVTRTNQTADHKHITLNCLNTLRDESAPASQSTAADYRTNCLDLSDSAFQAINPLLDKEATARWIASISPLPIVAGVIGLGLSGRSLVRRRRA